VSRRRAIVMKADDDVATALTDLATGECVAVSAGDRDLQVVLQEPVEFGHKRAMRDISEGEDVLKYGLPIGKAMGDIKRGQWVHVHNCRSEHFGFHRDQYGLKA